MGVRLLCYHPANRCGTNVRSVALQSSLGEEEWPVEHTSPQREDFLAELQVLYHRVRS